MSFHPKKHGFWKNGRIVALMRRKRQNNFSFFSLFHHEQVMDEIFEFHEI